MSPLLSNRRALRHALEMVERMSGADMIVVPSVPTNAMIEAGARAGKITPGAAEDVYSAMIQEA